MTLARLACLFTCLLAPLAASAQTAPTTPKYPGAYAGFTLVAPMNSNAATLIDMDGNVVHTWQSNFPPALSTYILDNGHLLRTVASLGGGFGGGMGMGRGRGAGAAGSQPATRPSRPSGAGAGGRVQEIAWDGTVLWDYEFVTDTQVPHHDITRLPNGNILMLIWDAKTAEQSIAAGRKPEYQNSGGELPPDAIIEVKPTGKNSGQIVWEWHVWDHLIQDFDKDKPHFGDVAAHPELIDINYSESWMDPAPAGGGGGRGGGGGAGRRGGMGGGMGMGGMGGGMGGGRIATTDWTHLNAVAYNPDRDQIIVSSYTFSEFWIIDHSTTTAQAASHAGGKSGKGGDLLYRFGNPEAYRHGNAADQSLFCPHNAQWIAPGFNGAGHVLIFNNGPNRPDGQRFSTVDEFELPVDKNGAYARLPNGSFAPPKLAWQYAAPNKTDFYSTNISGAQRLPNGNTLICSGANGKLFEVAPDGKTVWQYTVSNTGRGGPARGPAASAPTTAGALPAGRAGGMGGGMGAMGGMGGAMGRGMGGGMGMGGIGGGTMIFRAYRYAASDPQLRPQNLPAPATPQPAP